VHAQDRFFQMDLLRRQPAGELAELFGSVAFPADRGIRLHRFRAMVGQRIRTLVPRQRGILQAYAQGVNAGLESLGAAPFEYLVLRTDPQAWKPEDSLLVVLAMFLSLQDEQGRGESALGLMHDFLPRSLFEFLTPRGTEWDASLTGEAFATPSIPDPEGSGQRQAGRRRQQLREPLDESPIQPKFRPGSNNWAVSGEHTQDGRPLLANDMHLSLDVPNIWYRASFAWKEDQAEHQVHGVTLPGVPAIVIGSNGSVAWGLTSGPVDTNDVVLLQIDPQDDQSYLTPEGPRRFERHTEVLKSSQGDQEELEVLWTVWGPVLPPDAQGRSRASRWVAHFPESLNMDVLDLEKAESVEAALDTANRMGVPPLNFIASDAQGHIGWTMAGRFPRRVGFEGRLPGSWADGSRRWDGLLDPSEMPRVVDPEQGRIWTANNRVVGGEMYRLLGDDGLGLGARARQIRDALLKIESATAEDLLKIQLDSRAVFLQRWHDLILEELTPEAIQAYPDLSEVRRLLEEWGGCACADSVGYRIVRAFRLVLANQIFNWIAAPCLEAVPRFSYTNEFPQWEGPLWKLVTERPQHLLDPEYQSWEEQILSTLDRVQEAMQRDGRPLAEQSWGKFNRSAIRHPLSSALGLGAWLDMPSVEMPGDTLMPRVQSPFFGASQRMVVSPGAEEKGIFHMPTGQSGHPLSPHYSDSHSAWVEGKPTPFLPGEPVHLLTLRPAG
ncbi:MAG: penicillin acylase family protein, partial [Acidobacteriota bacterium]